MDKKTQVALYYAKHGASIEKLMDILDVDLASTPIDDIRTAKVSDLNHFVEGGGNKSTNLYLLEGLDIADAGCIELQP